MPATSSLPSWLARVDPSDIGRGTGADGCANGPSATPGLARPIAPNMRGSDGGRLPAKRRPVPAHFQDGVWLRLGAPLTLPGSCSALASRRRGDERSRGVRVRAVVAHPCVTLQSSVPATTPEFRHLRPAGPCGSLRPPTRRPPERGQRRDRTRPRPGSSPPRRWPGRSAPQWSEQACSTPKACKAVTSRLWAAYSMALQTSGSGRTRSAPPHAFMSVRQLGPRVRSAASKARSS